MIAKGLKYAKYGSRYVGIEHVSIDGEESINGLVLKLKKGELIKEKNFVGAELNELKQQIPKDQHLFLIVNNDQIITKQVDIEVEEEHILSEAFPNLDINHFHMEILRSKYSVYISICRKDYLAKLLKNYEDAHLTVVGFSLGNMIINQLSSFGLPDQFYTSNAKIVLQENQVKVISKDSINESPNYQINGLAISNRELLSLSGILQYFFGTVRNVHNMNSELGMLGQEFKQKRIFKLGFQGALIFLFTSLLISFLCFTNYSQQVANLSQELSLNKSAKNNLLQLNVEVSQKEKLIKDFSLSSSKASFFLDQLGQSVPNSILLERMEYQPLEKKIKAEKEVSVLEGEINLGGTFTKSDEFSQWVNNLEELEWIDQIIIQDYGMDSASRLMFELNIVLK